MKEIISSEAERIKKIFQADLEEMENLPNDLISIKRIGKQVYLYKKDDFSKNKKGRYVYVGNANKLDREYICSIIRRDFLNERIRVNRNNLEIVSGILPLLEVENYENIYKKITMIDTFSFVSKSDSDFLRYKGREAEALTWQNKSNIAHFKEDNLIHMTARGLKVRSKSELLIASALEERRLLFKYEPEIKAESNYVFRPDFVVLRPGDMKEIYWEHFGLMNDPVYEKRTMEKLVRYQQEGLCLWDNLIISFDSDRGSFNMQTINRIIDMFILMK